MSSSAIFFVSVVIKTLPPSFTTVLISESRSSICPRVGFTVITGSSNPVGRMSCSTGVPDCSSSYGAGVADTNTTCGTRASNSGNVSGRLSNAACIRKPYSTKFFLRDKSPWYIALICGIVIWLSSINTKNSPAGK